MLTEGVGREMGNSCLLTAFAEDARANGRQADEQRDAAGFGDIGRGFGGNQDFVHVVVAVTADLRTEAQGGGAACGNETETQGRPVGDISGIGVREIVGSVYIGGEGTRAFKEDVRLIVGTDVVGLTGIEAGDDLFAVSDGAGNIVEPHTSGQAVRPDEARPLCEDALRRPAGNVGGEIPVGNRLCLRRREGEKSGSGKGRAKQRTGENVGFHALILLLSRPVLCEADAGVIEEHYFSLAYTNARTVPNRAGNAVTVLSAQNKPFLPVRKKTVQQKEKGKHQHRVEYKEEIRCNIAAYRHSHRLRSNAMPENNEKEPRDGRNLSRRNFLKGVGVIGAGSGLVTELLSPEKTADAETRPAHPAPEGVTRKKGFQSITLHVNGRETTMEIEPRTTLLNALRNHADPPITGPKLICDVGACGGCTVLVDGKTAYSCLLLAADMTGRQITTSEGLLGKNGELSPVQGSVR